MRRDLAGGVGGTLAAIAMLVLGLWIVHQPRESVGRLADLSDEVALGAISAPQSGSIDRPVGSYAEAMSQTWSRLGRGALRRPRLLRRQLGARPAASRSGQKSRRLVLRGHRRPRAARRLRNSSATPEATRHMRGASPASATGARSG